MMIIKLQDWVNRVSQKLFGPGPKFQKDDSVQHVSGGPLMVVVWVKQVKNSAHVVFCKWYDRERKATKTNIFSENELKVFDWYNPT